MTETLSKDLAGLVEKWRERTAYFSKAKVPLPADAVGALWFRKCADELYALLAQHAVAEPQTLGQRMGDGAPAVLLQKIEAILGRCVFDQPDSLTYDEGVKLVRELVAPAPPPPSNLNWPSNLLPGDKWPVVPHWLRDPIVFRDKNLGIALVATTPQGEQWIHKIVNGQWMTVRKTDERDPMFIVGALNQPPQPPLAPGEQPPEQIIEIDEDGKVHGDISGLKKGDQ